MLLQPDLITGFRLVLTLCVTLILQGCVLQPVNETADSTEVVVATSSTESSAENINADVQAEHVVINENVNDQLFPTMHLDVWDRIRHGFTLPAQEHRRIEQELKWYARHPEYMNRVAERARPYIHYIIEAIEAANIPSEIALLPIVESAFQPFAYSHGRAAGIWQFIPATGKRYGLKQNWWYDGRRDVYASTQAAIKLLKNLTRQFKGDWMLALAAYNSGEGTVKKAIRRNKRKGKATDFWSLHLPKETRAYVPKLLALKRIVATPEAYNLTLKTIPDKKYFDRVEMDSQIDLALASELADVSLDEIYRLNAGYNRWATAPKGPHDLLLPSNKVEHFKTQLAQLPAEKRIRWIRHRVKNGETLGTIAQKFHTSIRTIKRINRIRGNTIRAGRGITIPVASRALRDYKLSASQRLTKQQNIPRQGKKINYIVQQGDSFWDLARYHRVGVRQLAKWNNMAPRDPLRAGQKLIIWSRRGSALTSANAEHLQAPPRRNITKRIGYRVRSGDSLARISSKFRVSISQLKRWNRKISKSKYLQPGQWLTLFVDVARQSGSS